MDEELYKKVKDDLLNANRETLNRQNYFTGAMSIGCSVSCLVSIIAPELLDGCLAFTLLFTSGIITSSMLSLIMRYNIDREARDYTTKETEASEKTIAKQDNLSPAFHAKEVETLKEEEYPEAYFQAKILKEYVEAVNFDGAQSLAKLLASIMSQLQKPMTAEWQEVYKNVINKIVDRAYNKALKAYNLPYVEKEEYNLNELVLKAKVLENYVMDIAYPGYETDLEYLYQAISESKCGSITPENFNEWIHYIAQRAYQSALSEGVTR